MDDPEILQCFDKEGERKYSHGSFENRAIEEGFDEAVNQYHNQQIADVRANKTIVDKL